MAREIWVRHSYLVQATPVRAKKARWFPFLAETPVSIGEIEAFEDMRAAVVSQDKPPYVAADRPRHWAPPKPKKTTWTKGNRSIGPSPVDGMERHSHWYAGHGGRLYRPLRAPGDRNAPLTPEALDANAGDPRFWDHPFLTSKLSRGGLHRLAERTDADFARLRTIHVDCEEEARERVARTASGLVLHEGGLWQVADPMLVVSLESEFGRRTVSLDVAEPPFGSRKPGLRFSLDRYDEALAFARSLAGGTAGAPAARLQVDPRIVEADPRHAAADMGPANARSLVHAVHGAAKDARYGEAAPLAEAIMEALGGERPYRGVHLAGNPFDLADRVMGWSEQALVLQADSRGGSAATLAATLATLAEPFLHGREFGLAAAAGDSFFREEDLAGFRFYADEDPNEAEAFAP